MKSRWADSEWRQPLPSRITLLLHVRVSIELQLAIPEDQASSVAGSTIFGATCAGSDVEPEYELHHREALGTDGDFGFGKSYHLMLSRALGELKKGNERMTGGDDHLASLTGSASDME